jgi:radical SAM protein with 4Fe4S-binding SPASM domain
MLRWKRISDFFVLVGSLNFRRLLNLIRLGFGYIAFMLFKTTTNRGFPMAVSIEPTTSCNLRCPECPTGKGILSRSKGNMDLGFFKNIIGQLNPQLMYLTLYFQGEPYLNKQFYEMISYARSRKIYVATSTNGHFLDDVAAKATVRSGLNRLIVSLDGTNQDSYSTYRKGGDFNKVTEGIKRVVAWRRKLGVRHPYLIVQFLVLSSNEHQINAIRKLGYELGADEVQLKTAQFDEYKSGNSLLPSDKKFSRYSGTNEGGFVPAFTIANRCFRMWSSAVITWDGMLVPCCFDKNANHRLGNLANEDFKLIWESKGYNKFRSQVRNSRKQIAICCNCSQRW